MPIVDVTWEEAQEYCRWVEGRLPTEAEWEYAARAGERDSRYGPLDEIAWYADNSGAQRLDSTRIWGDQKNYPQRLKANGNGMHEVGQKRANAWGLYDMLGNLWEWVNDWYDAHYYQNSPTADPPGPAHGINRVVRSGSWAHYEKDLRLSTRVGVPPGSRGAHGHGFRCVSQTAPRAAR
jgi:formylglycine-generating enzyme required for sulfatase activity